MLLTLIIKKEQKEESPQPPLQGGENQVLIIRKNAKDKILPLLLQEGENLHYQEEAEGRIPSAPLQGGAGLRPEKNEKAFQWRSEWQNGYSSIFFL